MATFFKKFRIRFLREGKTSQYLKYAFGEIVLVVIGILIALSINNWNQNRILKLEENTILTNIHGEFLQNKKVIHTSIQDNDKALQATTLIMQLMGKVKIEIQKHNVDSLLFVSLETGEFRPSDNTILDLLQSGRLQLIQNENLKDLLYQWSRSLKSSNVSFERVELKIDNELVPYLSKKYSMKDLDMYGALQWKKKSILKVDKIQIFSDPEFENILDDYLYRILGNKRELNVLVGIIDEILKETKNLK